MGCLKSDIVRVGELSNKESWELFCMIAFFGRSSEEQASLEEIGRKVVAKCKGLPLAIKAIAGVLQLKEGLREWQNVLDSELWNWEGFRRDIAPALWLSYYDLPSHLKQCFSYCAIFPKDYEMKKDELIRHWVAQGYIKETKSKDVQMVGEEYFHNLVMRSFFQDVEVENFETTCKMHDIVHDFSQLLVKNQCHSIEVNDLNEEISFSNDSFAHSPRHLSIIFQNKVKCVFSFDNLKKLHTLIFSSSNWMSKPLLFGLDLQKLFTEFTLLRSLVLINCGIEEVPSNINRLIHLRELDLSRNAKLKELTETVWELYNLQIMILEATGIQSLKGIGRLTNLMYLGNIETNCWLPKEVVRLSCLRRLNWVDIDVNNEEALSLKHLKNFNKLGGLLGLRWLKRCDGDAEDAKQAQLIDKKHITHLVLDFGSIEEEDDGGGEEGQRRKKQDEELVGALNTPPNLESLWIKAYMGTPHPTWFHSLTALKLVGLIGWRQVEHMPPFGKLPCLESLLLFHFDKVVKMDIEFLGIDLSVKSIIVNPFFPKLKSLKFDHFNNWEEWNDVDGNEEMLIMPSLTSLKIKFCRKLKALPNFILNKTSLIKLKIKNCGSLEQSTY